MPVRKPLAPVTAVPTGRTGLLAPTGPARLENARYLPVDDIRENPEQARQHFDEAALDELTDSVRQHGILQPIVVRPVGEQYVIVAGERRWRAAIAAGVQFVPAIIRDDLVAEDDAAIVTALENLQRDDLDPEDEARQFARLLELTGLSQRALAEQLGKTHNYVSRRVRLLKERPELFAAIRAGRMTQEAALDSLAADHGVYQAGTNPTRTPRAEMPPLREPARWRDIGRTYRALGRIQPDTVPWEDVEGLAKQLGDLETLAATTRRALLARLEQKGRGGDGQSA